MTTTIGHSSPIKGSTYRHYFFTYHDTDDSRFAQETLSVQTYISKDGGTIYTTTNSAVGLARDTGVNDYNANGYYVDLTASEMDADDIMLFISDIGDMKPVGVHLRTVESELSSIATKDSSVSEKITAMFQYFFFKRTVTVDTETLYKDNGSSSLGTSTISDDGTTVTHGEIS